ncbi:hypothetical protein NE237_006851 [Protea cynaroides]|uniref:Uncharacterized protein n=1 Tax=Protea cynaroides TaxID=273540 RepID=A0A9Q0QVU3_9MAGN|nr:hypothetical protein NE237_006851 [Protea cynaroides]
MMPVKQNDAGDASKTPLYIVVENNLEEILVRHGCISCRCLAWKFWNASLSAHHLQPLQSYGRRALCLSLKTDPICLRRFVPCLLYLYKGYKGLTLLPLLIFHLYFAIGSCFDCSLSYCGQFIAYLCRQVSRKFSPYYILLMRRLGIVGKRSISPIISYSVM